MMRWTNRMQVIQMWFPEVVHVLLFWRLNLMQKMNG